MNKPQVLLALSALPNSSPTIHRMSHLSSNQIDTYYALQKLIEKNKQHLGHCTQKAVAGFCRSNQKENKEKQEGLPKDIQRHIQAFAAPTDHAQHENPNLMDPRLKDAIKNGKADQITHLLNHGVRLDNPTENGHDAHELAAIHGHMAILKKLVENSKYIDPIKQKKLLQLAKNNKELRKPMRQKLKWSSLKNLLNI